MKNQKQFKTVTREMWSVGPNFEFLYSTDPSRFFRNVMSPDDVIIIPADVISVRVTITPLPARRKAKVKR